MNNVPSNWTNRKNSKDVARERLKLVLLHDRNDFSPQLVNRISRDIVKVLSQYLELNESDMDIEIKRISSNRNMDDNNSSALVANIPIKSVRDMSVR